MFFPKCHQFTYYYCKQVSMCHKLFKYKIINRVTIYRAKSSGIRTYQELFLLWLSGIKQKYKYHHAKNRAKQLMQVFLCKSYSKMFWEFWENNTLVSILHKMFLLSACLMVWLWQGFVREKDENRVLLYFLFKATAFDVPS